MVGDCRLHLGTSAFTFHPCLNVATTAEIAPATSSLAAWYYRHCTPVDAPEAVLRTSGTTIVHLLGCKLFWTTEALTIS